MKKSILKKWWFWVIIVVIIAVVSSVGGSDETDNAGGNAIVESEKESTVEKENTDQADTTEENEENTQQEAVIIEEQVLLEQDGIKITAKELKEDTLWGHNVSLLIENTSEQNLTVQVRDMSVNGIMTDPMFSCDVAAGKSANDAITLMQTSLEAAGITTIQNMEFSFHIFNTDSWENVLDSDVIYLSTSADGAEEQEVNENPNPPAMLGRIV